MSNNSHKTLYQILEEAKKRFWAKVDKEHPSGCWMWLGCRGKYNDGYGSISFDGRIIITSRFSWFIHFGAPPDDLCVLHTCDTPGCVRPDHLFLGTQQDNARDRCAKGRQAKQKGSANANARLTEDGVRYLRQHYKPGYPYHPGNIQELADKFGITVGQVWNIARRKQWTHLAGE